MTSFQKSILAFLAIVAAALFAFVFWLYSGAWNKPLGPALQLSTATQFKMPPTWTPESIAGETFLSTPETVINAVQAVSPSLIAASSPTIAPASTNPAVTGLCGGPAVMTILAVGTDARGNNYTYGLGDVIRLVRIDFVNPKVTVLEFPRDLWVEIPDIADNISGQDHERLNQAYLYGNPGFGYTDDPAHGPGLMAHTLALNFGTNIDHYAAVNMRTFEKIVNAVGGIDVNLPQAVDGRTTDDPNKRLLFERGRHHLDGTRALTLARIRIKGTFARADNQNRVLCALRDKLTSPKVVTKIPQLIESFQGAIQTDLTPAQLGQLACIGTQLQPGNIVFASFPEEYFTATRIYDPVFKGRVFIWDVDFNILRDYVTQFNQGTWPAPGGTRESTGTKEEGIPFCP
jgi:LCP family protein required for cell wall assembly